ncbi:MAG: hypothetical protein Q4A55_07135 [Aerococcus sp.]|nr:hypothetical protein [Aerococcus sp.]
MKSAFEQPLFESVTFPQETLDLLVEHFKGYDFISNEERYQSEEPSF